MDEYDLCELFGYPISLAKARIRKDVMQYRVPLIPEPSFKFCDSELPKVKILVFERSLDNPLKFFYCRTE